MIPSKIRSGKSIRGFLDGQMLVAMPGMQDERFVRSVVYVCAHSDDGAMGLVVNRRAKNLPFHELMVQLKILDDSQSIRLPASADRVEVLNGGPVEKSRGFVLHSTDFFLENSSLPLDEGIALTITVDILKAIARGEGPEQAVVALGYAGWAPGQLEREIQENGWLHCPASPSLIFGRDHEAKYDQAMRSIGIDPRMLVADAGHA